VHKPITQFAEILHILCNLLNLKADYITESFVGGNESILLNDWIKTTPDYISPFPVFPFFNIKAYSVLLFRLIYDLGCRLCVTLCIF